MEPGHIYYHEVIDEDKSEFVSRISFINFMFSQTERSTLGNVRPMEFNTNRGATLLRDLDGRISLTEAVAEGYASVEDVLAAIEEEMSETPENIWLV